MKEETSIGIRKKMAEEEKKRNGPGPYVLGTSPESTSEGHCVLPHMHAHTSASDLTSTCEAPSFRKEYSVGKIAAPSHSFPQETKGSGEEGKAKASKREDENLLSKARMERRTVNSPEKRAKEKGAQDTEERNPVRSPRGVVKVVLEYISHGSTPSRFSSLHPYSNPPPQGERSTKLQWSSPPPPSLSAPRLLVSHRRNSSFSSASPLAASPRGAPSLSSGKMVSLAVSEEAPEKEERNMEKAFNVQHGTGKSYLFEVSSGGRES